MSAADERGLGGYDLLERAHRARRMTMVGAGVLIAADASAFLGSDVRWVLSLGLALLGWIVGVSVYVVIHGSGSRPPREMRPFGTGLLTCVLGGTGLGPTARAYIAAAFCTELPPALRTRADRAWRVCRFGAVVTTATGGMLVVAVVLSLMWVEQESTTLTPDPWYFMVPLIAGVFGGFIVLLINGSVALVSGLLTPTDEQ